MPEPHEIGSNVIEFLEILGKPTWITIKGKDPSRLRVVVTLLHGNEPSGVKAIYRWLGNPVTPATNMAFFIGYVEAALEPQLFTHRYLPGDKDLNRCFAAPSRSSSGSAKNYRFLRISNLVAFFGYSSSRGGSL